MESTTVPKRHWATLALMTGLFALSGIDRSLISILAEPIKHEFGLSDSQLGVLTGLAFAIPYTLVGLPIGILADRIHRLRLSYVLVTCWSVVTLLTSWISSFAGMLAMRACLGMAESGVAPIFSSLTSDLFPKARRSTAMALLYVSSPIGLTVGFGAGGIIAGHLGWRATFAIAGIVGTLAALILLLVKEPERGRYDDPADAPCETAQPVLSAVASAFARQPVLPLILGAASASIAAQAGIGAFMAPFMIRIHGMTIAQAGLFIALGYGVGGMIGMPLGGLITDWVKVRLPGREMLVAVVAQCLAAAMATIAFGAGDLRIALGALVLYSIFCVAAYGVTFATFVSYCPVAIRGTAMAVLLIAQNLVGYGFGPGLTGYLSDRFAQAGWIDPLRYALISMCLFYLIAAGFFALTGGLIRRTDMQSRDRPGMTANT